MTTSDADAVIGLTQQLIGIDSVNPGLVPGAAGEQAIADLLADRLTRAGFDVQLVAPSSDERRVSVIAVCTGPAAGRTVVLNGHLDTVGVDGMPEPFAARIHGDRLLGRGASDMKGGVAGLVLAAEELVARRVPGRIVVALVADEEDSSLGATAVIDHLHGRGITADVCLIAEPTWLDVAVAHRGYALLRVALEGRAAHSSQPELGADVVVPLTRMLTGVAAQQELLRSRDPHPLLGSGSLMATVVRAGSAPFTVAADAEVIVERRTLPGESIDAGSDEVDAIVERAITDAREVTATVTPLLRRSPWEADATGPAAELSALLADALEAVGGRRPDRVGAPYWMESALWQEAGVPTVVCGPAGGGLHAVDEWIGLDQLRCFPVAVADAVGRFLEGRA